MSTRKPKRVDPAAKKAVTISKDTLDPPLVRELCFAQLPDSEIAALCKIGEEDLLAQFGELLDKWRAEGVAAVRRELYMTDMGASKGRISAITFFLKNFGGMGGPAGEGPDACQGQSQAEEDQLPPCTPEENAQRIADLFALAVERAAQQTNG